MRPRTTAFALIALVSATVLSHASDSDRSAAGRAFLEAFQKVAAGTEVAQVRLPAGSLASAKIYPIGFQTGIWFVHVETGLTVFSIYPYRNEDDGAQCGVVVIKVDAERMSVDELLAAFRGESKGPPLHIVEHSESFPDGRHFHTSKTEANRLVGSNEDVQK